MRIKHTKVPGLVALGMSLALLTACGGDAEPEASPSPTEEATEEATEEPTDEPTEEVAPERADADLVIWADDVKAQSLQEPAKAWGEANGISVAVQSVSGSLRDLFITADQASNGPDVVIGAHDWIGQLVQNSSIVPVTIPDTADFGETSLAAMNYEGQTFGVPYAVETLGLFANNALTADPAPATMEALIAAAQAGGAENPLCLQVGQTGDVYHMQPLFTSAGGYVFGANDDGSLNAQDVGVDSEGGLAAAAKLGELGTAGVLKTSIDGTNSIPLFAEGKCAYMVSGPWALGQIEEAGVDYALSVIPGFDGMNPARSFATVNGFYVAAHAQNGAFAQQFVSDLAGSTELSAGMFETNQLPPAQKSLIAELSADFPNVVKFGELVDNADPMPAIPEMSSVWGPLGQSQANIVGGADPAETIKAAAEEIRSAIGG